MSKDNIDLSIGLAPSLEIIKRYKQSGSLFATIPYIPGLGGPYNVWINVAKGDVFSCSLEGDNGQRYILDIQALLRLDKERGPFGWSFRVSSPGPPREEPPPSSLPTTPIPRPIAPFDAQFLHGWAVRDKLILRMVYALVDGKRTVDDIKAKLSLSPESVENALQTLQSMQVIIVK